MKYKFIVIFALLLSSACRQAQAPNAPASASTKTYKLKGTVVSVDKQNKTAEINSEAIPGYMEAMTMEFPIRDTWVWDDLSPGSAVQADLVVDNSGKGQYWLEKLGIVAAPNPNQPQPPIATAPQIGKSVPDVRLTDQDGKRFSLTDYRGKAFAITFIYRECPLPNFCIKMSQNFSDAAARIAADPAYRDKLKLLSISFDPARDTPAKLRQYGQGYLGNQTKPDFSIWRLAVGGSKDIRSVADFFGLKYETDENDKTLINHSLVTAVIGPDGVVKKIFVGNRWAVDELVRSLQETAG